MVKRRVKNTKLTRERHREKIADIKNNHPCVDCGKKYPHYVLQFDHLKDKSCNVSNMPGNVSWKKIQKEIDKC